MFAANYIQWIHSVHGKRVDTSYETPYMAAPCPFCDHRVAFDEHDFLYPENRERNWWKCHCDYSCGGCGAEGPGAETEYEALLLWNARGDPRTRQRATG